MNKRKKRITEDKNFCDPPFRTISKSNQNHNTPERSKSQWNRKNKTQTHVSSIYKKKVLTVLVMGINKSDTIIFIIYKSIHRQEGGFYEEAETKL